MDEIERLEKLSKLSFSSDEKEKFKSDFKKILAFVDEIKAVEVDESFEKDSAVKLSSLRVDEPQTSIKREEALLNAPKQKDGCFVTPLVVE